MNHVRKLTLPSGIQAGILHLDEIMSEVADSGLTSAEEIKTELLAKVKESNYVASGVESDYASALLEEYLHRYDKSSSATKKVKHKKPHAG